VRSRGSVAAALVGAGLVAWALSEPLLLDLGRASRPLCLLVALALALPCVVLRRWPGPAAALVVAVYVVRLALDARPVGGVAAELVLAFALFGAAAWSARWVGPAVVGGGFVAGAVVLPDAPPALALYLAAVGAAGVGAGLALRDRRGAVARLRAEVTTLEARVVEQVGAAVETERAALDRSLARIVTHLVAEIRVLAADADRALDRDPAMASALARRMAAVAGTAGDQLRGMLGELHAAPEVVAPPDGRRRRARIVALAGLAAPAVLLAAFGVADQLQAPSLPRDVTAWGMTFRVPAPALGPAAGLVLAVLTPLALLGRRRAPVLAVAVTMAFVVGRTWHGDLSSVTFAQTFVGVTAAFVAAAWARSSALALLGGALALGGTAASWALEQAVFTVAQYGYMTAGLVAGWACGWALREQLRAAAALRGETAQLLARREGLIALAVGAERRRVALDLHDVVGHGLSLVNLQAGVLQRLAERDAGRAREALGHIERAATTTARELDVLRGLLHAPGRPEGEGLAMPAVQQLLADSEQAGHAVHADVDAGFATVPVAVGSVAVRVLQEALTNARKHAPGASTDVTIEVGDGRVRIDVRTAGVPAAAPAPASGHGLAGMAERVEALGGTVQAGPSAGGWVVSAEVPLAA
jgi:signal transduction histidine kinase